jgi:multidrug efflux pump
MTLPEICIKRPVFATVLSLVVLVLGIMAYSRLTIREYPRIDDPVVSVETSYRGASAEVMESQVTKVLEDSLAGIEGVDIISSQSRAENSQINVRFRINRDPDSAAADVRDKVSRVRGRMPDAVDEPVIAKVEADADPVMWLAMSSDKHTQLEVSDYVTRYVRPRLQTLPGAADVRIFGERRISMRIWVDREKLAAYRMAVQEVEEAIRRQNVEVPSGRIEGAQREFTVLTLTDLSTADQFGAIVLRTEGGYPIRLRDVARIERGPLSERTLNRFNGKPAVGMGVIRQATANPLELSQAIRKELAEINPQLPPGMKLEINYDSSRFIEESLKAVVQTIIEATILVAAVIFLFLRNLRATIIPLVTIPISLIGACALMYAFGFSINTLTLLAMVLAVGLVVDDAIVVLENIYRNIEKGMSRLEAALQGSREIAFAVIAMTITLAAVYAPLAFLTGRTGRLFNEFALTLAGAVVVSGFVALTLTPMMCSLILRHDVKHGAVYNAIERLFNAMNSGYARLLNLALTHRWVVVGVAAGVAAFAGYLFTQIKSELAPLEDRGSLFAQLSSPEGTTLPLMDDNIRRVEAIYQQVPELRAMFTVSGNPTPASGFAMMRLKDWSDRERKQQQIQPGVQQQLGQIPGASVFLSQPASLGQGRGKPLQFVIMTPRPYDELQGMVDRFIAEVRKNPGLQNVDSDLRLNKPELKVSVNRERLADAGVSVETVGRTLETMLGGRLVTRFKEGGDQYDVVVQVTNTDRATPADIASIFVRGRNGEMLSLSNFVSVREGLSPRSLNHFNRLRSAIVDAQLAPGYTMGEALKYMNETSVKVLGAETITDLSGQSREFRTSSGDSALVFALAIVFIFLVLAAQFESFRDPLIILLTVPLSMAGALAALWIGNGTLNVYSQIGLVTLVGLITKHGILIVEFANQLQERGHSIKDAVVEAAQQRLRPILMTTGAMVLGAIPLALARGAGAESRQQIGLVIVGGLLLGTVLTLFVVPVAYSIIARKRLSFEERVAKESTQSHGVDIALNPKPTAAVNTGD